MKILSLICMIFSLQMLASMSR
uniref:Uncharacterized protein n=1 Tax=Arundo donax TaxID=35708 RepID=A0A0A9BNJ3_ARUDO